jgi:hypothetical protein
MKVYLLSFYLVLLTTFSAGAGTKVVMPQHPRLFITKDDVTQLKMRFNHPDYAQVRIAFEKQLAYSTDGVSTDGSPDEKIRQKMETAAFQYLIDPIKNESYGKIAINIAKSYLPSITKVSGYAQNLYCYEAVVGASIVYDWCYNILSAEDKKELISDMKRVCCLGEYCLERITPKQYLSGHYGENGASVFLAMGIATYDEDQEYFDFEYAEQVNNFALSRNPMFESETHHQGSQYIAVRYFNEVMQAYLLEKIGLNPYSKKISGLAYRGIYQTVPQLTDMDGMAEGDCHNSLGMGYFPYPNLAAQLSKDPVLQSYSKWYLSKSDNYSMRAFIFHDASLKSEPIESLKLTKFFPSPSGIMIARTKWDFEQKDYDSKAMVVLMNMREYSAKNHVHLDNGHFSIYYKGHLALDAGIYQGKDDGNGWGKVNYVNYYARTVAHNSILIFDPNEPSAFEGWNKRTASRDGGQFSFKNYAWDTSKEMFDAGKSTQILACDIAAGNEPEYSYLKGDMTRAYNCPPNVAVYPAKTDTVRRSFVFLNLKSDKVPGALIVMDKIVSTNPTFKKTWLLHSQNEPVIAKNTIQFENTADGRNSKLYNDVLLPEIGNQDIQKIGGAGNEYWVDGKNWGSVTQEDAGRWRIELSPKQPSLSDNFLNVIQVMDVTPAQNPLAVTKVMAAKGNYVVVSIADRVVAQQLTMDKNENEIELSIADKTKKYKVLVTDLVKGVWTITTPSGIQKINVADSIGSVYFNSFGGKIILSPEKKALPRSACNSCIIVKNTLSILREKEIITINRSELQQKDENLVPVIRRKSEILTSQVSDANGDGKWDQLLVEVSLKPLKADTLSISWVSSKNLPAFSKCTNVRFSYKSTTNEPTAEILKLSRGRGFTQDISKPVFQMEGPGIENDKVAFRHFFDKRNGKDLYGKLTNEMILEKIGLDGSWHELRDWGMDILHTGGSIGAGSIAVKEGNLIYPLADADNINFKQIEEGSLRAAYKLNFKNWDMGTTKADGYERISMNKGDFFYHEEVKVPLMTNQKLISGMPNFFSDSINFTFHNKKFSSISTFAKQADGKTPSLLGLAVLFASDAFAGNGKSQPNESYIKSNYVELKPTANQVHSLRFFACWEKSDSRFSTKNGFESYLQEVADKLAYPIKVTIPNKNIK